MSLDRMSVRKLAVCAGVAVAMLMNVGTASASPAECVTFCDEPPTPLVKIDAIFQKTQKPPPDKQEYLVVRLTEVLITSF
jgi:cyclic lactone autoinducer peptide